MPYVKYSHCKNGHDFNGPNIIITPEGWRICKLCKTLREKKRRAKLVDSEIEYIENKKCPKCQETKHRDDFHKTKTRRYGLSAYCKLCYKIDQANYRINNSEHVKLLDTKRRNKKENKEKMREYSKINYINNKEKVLSRCRYNSLKRDGVNITFKELSEWMDLQEKVCCICGIPETQLNNRSLDIDHDHIKKTLRGLLCGKCNAGIGLLKDSPELIEKALKYLVTHGSV